MIYRAEHLTQNHYLVDSDAGLNDLTTYYWRVEVREEGRKLDDVRHTRSPFATVNEPRR